MLYTSHMTEIYLYTFTSVLVVSLVSLIGVIVISFNKKMLQAIIPTLVSVAVGAMLGDAFVHLIPEAFEATNEPITVSLLIIAGMLLFFILEKFLHWHHSHGEHDIDEYGDCDHMDEEGKVHPVGHMILVSDGFHNFIDGLIIGASFLISVPIGIASTIAILLHEIPQEIGDFGVLLHAGYTKSRALLVNFLSAILAFLGAGTALILGDISIEAVQYLLPIAAGVFIYIATADLIPELHKTTEVKYSILQLLAFILGIVLIASLVFLE